VDPFIIITSISAVVGVIWGVYSVRDIVRKNQLSSETRIISAIDTKLGTIQTEIDKNEQLFQSYADEKDKLILSLKDDIHVLEKHLEDLCNRVSRHDGILETHRPLLEEVRNTLSDLKIQVGVLEKGLE